MAILLTGSTGTLGTELVPLLREKGHHIYGLSRHLSQPADSYTPIQGDITKKGLGLAETPQDIHAVFHQAASISFNEAQRSETFEINCDGTKNVLDFMVDNDINRIFYVSTAYIAGDHKKEFHEHHFDVGQKFRNSYEESKFEAESIIRSFIDKHGIKATIFRPSIFIGRSDNGTIKSFEGFYFPLRCIVRAIDHFETKMKLPSHRTIEQLLGLPPLPISLIVYGDPDADLNLIPVDICAQKMVEIMDHGPGTYHITDSQPLSVAEVYQTISDTLSIGDILVSKHHKLDPVSQLYNRLVRVYEPYLSYGSKFTSSVTIPPATAELIEKTVVFWDKNDQFHQQKLLTPT